MAEPITWLVRSLIRPSHAGAIFRQAFCRYDPKSILTEDLMTRFLCPYLHAEVELTDERERHIAQHHPDLLPHWRTQLAETIEIPDQVRRSLRFEDARMFSRWYGTILGGKYIVAIVITDASTQRNWVITAYLARRLAGGEVEWKRS